MVIDLNLSDEQLAVAVREVDKELYGELIRRYSVKIGHYLRKFIRDNDELEDVLQLVFIKAYRNLFDFNSKYKFSPWLYRIAHNEALNFLKKYKREKVYLDETEWEIVDEKMNLNDKMDVKFLKEDIEKGLGKMKDKYREVLILYFFEQKTYEEIGEIMRLSRNTVGVLLMRAKEILKQILKEEKYV